MENNLTEIEYSILNKIEQGGYEAIKEYRLIYCYLDGKRNKCEKFDDYTKLVIDKLM